MFGIGWMELVVVFLIVLLVFGPKRLPEIGVAIGKALRYFKEASREVRESMSDVHSEFETHFRDVQQAGRDLTRSLLEPPEASDAPSSEISSEPDDTDRDVPEDESKSDETPDESDRFQSPYAG